MVCLRVQPVDRCTGVVEDVSVARLATHVR
jgi:hypothetical protein